MKFRNTSNIKRNFIKFLVDSHGEVVARYAPKKKPKSIEKDIEKLLEVWATHYSYIALRPAYNNCIIDSRENRIGVNRV